MFEDSDGIAYNVHQINYIQITITNDTTTFNALYIEVNFIIELESGDLEITIEDDDKNIISNVSSSELVNFDSEDKDYTLVIVANEAKGYFEIDWRK